MTVKLVTQDNRRHKAILVYGRINRTTFIKRNIKNTQIIDSREINEAKSLLGVIKIDKNEITHSNGILIRAMKEGFPLVIKNIDHNQRILHFLKPVIENSIITCNNMIIQAEKGFQLIFTSEKIINNRHLTVIGPFSLTYKKSIKKSLVNFPSHNKELNSENQKIIMYSILEKVYGENLNNEITREMHHKIKKFCSLKNIVDRNDFFFAFSTIFFGYLKYNERQAKENELRGILCLTSKCTHKTVVIPDSDISMTEQVRNTTNDILLLMENQIPILLVGETGVGKTHLVQTISKHSQFLLGKITKLVIVNFSSDLDINDLIGYYKSNDTYKLDFFRKRYKITIKDDKLCLLTILNILEKDKMYNKEEYMSIKNLLDNIDSKFIYQEGIFTEAIRNGYWILFDEINLASKEVLETLCAIINSKRIILFEKDGNEIINFHDNFQVFACMNPGNDHGKKDFNDCNFIKLFYDDFSFYLNDLEIISKNVISKLNKNNILQSNEKKCCNHKENDLYVTIARFYNDLKLNIENNKIKGV
ncbi:ribosomal large subunit assembly, partial [Conglomerata obtusa]